MQITIDCVPYKVEAFNHGNGLTIFDIEGSVLALLDNRTQITGNRFSDEHLYSVVYDEDENPHFLTVTFEEDDGLHINIDGLGSDNPLDLLANWVDSIFNAAESIGYEALYTHKHMEKYYNEF